MFDGRCLGVLTKMLSRERCEAAAFSNKGFRVSILLCLVAKRTEVAEATITDS